MASISALIDFLMDLMSDEDTKRSFAGNPDQTMADKGLRDVSAQDVKDARLIMADQGGVRPRPDGGSQANGYHDGGLTAGGGNSAVREILHTTNTFEIDQSKHIDQNIFNIDNHRTTIVDSFNSQDKVIAIQDNDITNNTDVDVDTGEDEDSDDERDDSTEDKAEDGTDTPDDTDVPTDPDGTDLPEPPLSEQPPDGTDPGDGPFPTEPEPPVADEPVDEDPGADPFPPEPEPMPEPEPEPVAEADELPVA